MLNVELSHKIIMRSTKELKARPDNPRTHSKKQLNVIAASIRQFGFTNPVLVDGNDRIVAGHARVDAARSLGIDQVPTILLGHLSPAELKAYVIMDNRSAELGGWDRDLLSLNLGKIEELDADLSLTLTGFDDEEIQLLRAIGKPKGSLAEAPVPEPDATQPVISRLDDVWEIGDDHIAVHGDARDKACYKTLLAGAKADLVFTDFPWNVPVQGHISGLGKARHKEFVMASGEMARPAYRRFISDFMGQLRASTRSGSVHYICSDWRSIADVIDLGEAHYDQLLNLAVWVKSNGGMGSFLRSQHELVAIFRNGRRSHLNNVALGANGRHRTNVWNYAGANAFGANRDAELAMHPTVKPVAMIADAIKDASQPGDLVLDCFGGSGSTLLAAQETGRRARLIELDGIYIDVTLRRAAGAGLAARLRGTGETFAEVAARRLEEGNVKAADHQAELFDVG